MRSFLTILGVCAALVMCAVSAAMNYLFLSSLGKTPLEGQVLGAASAAADVLKAVLPFFIAWSWRARRFVAAVSGTFAFLFFATFSFLSAIGFAADNRGVLVDLRDELANEYARVQRDQQSLEGQLGALPAHRPSAVVTEEIERHRQNRRWTATKACGNATEAESREFCGEYFRMRGELAAAKEAERLAGQIAALQSESSALKANDAGQDSDPQVALLSRISGLGEEPVRLGLIVAVAVLVEIGASLGLFLASGHRITSASSERAAAQPRSAFVATPTGSVEDFCLEALAASPHSTLPMDHLLAEYQAWCGRKGQAALDPASFIMAFAAIADAIGLRGGPAGYRGIALSATDTLALAA